MILRSYRVRVDPAKLGLYEEFERGEGLAMVRAMDGCIACGFGPIQEQKEPTYVFFSIWKTKDALEMARATPTWKRVTGKVEKLGLALDESAEHVDIKASSGLNGMR